MFIREVRQAPTSAMRTLRKPLWIKNPEVISEWIIKSLFDSQKLIPMLQISRTLEYYHFDVPNDPYHLFRIFFSLLKLPIKEHCLA